MLRRQASTAVIWSGLDQLVQQGLSFAISLVMARLVSPTDYGTIALLQLFTGIAIVFIDGGLTSALVQKKQATRADESTVFWFNILVGVLMSLGLFAAAPLIAGFYDKPILLPITRVVSLQLFLAACNSVQGTLFAKRLDFKTPLAVGMSAMVISGAVGIVLAWQGFGVWALVAQTAIHSVLLTFFNWRWSPWRPQFVFSRRSFRDLFGFGGFIFLSGLIDNIYSRLYTVIIGKMFGVHELGIYNRAENTKQLPTGILTGVLSRVAFPVFAQTSHDLPRLLRGFRLSIRSIMFINIPMMLGIAVVARPLVLTLFGSAWVEASPYLAILAVGGVLWPLHVLNLSILKATGESRKFFYVELLKKGVSVSLLLVGAHYGMEGMAYSVVASSFFSFVFNAYYNGKILNYGPLKQFIDFSPSLLCGLLMAFLVNLAANNTHFAPLLELLFLSVLGALVYFICVRVFRVSEYEEILLLFKQRLGRQPESGSAGAPPSL